MASILPLISIYSIHFSKTLGTVSTVLGEWGCFRSFVRNKTPSVGSIIYNTNDMNNADKKIHNNENVKTNIL